mgnify:CR=1 FL=1
MSTKQVNFLCFNCQMTCATIEKFSMHDCVKINQEAQVVDPRAVHAPQGDSKLKIEGNDKKTEKEVKSKEDVPSPFEKLPDEMILQIFSVLSFKINHKIYILIYQHTIYQTISCKLGGKEEKHKISLGNFKFQNKL